MSIIFSKSLPIQLPASELRINSKGPTADKVYFIVYPLLCKVGLNGAFRVVHHQFNGTEITQEERQPVDQMTLRPREIKQRKNRAYPAAH